MTNFFDIAFMEKTDDPKMISDGFFDVCELLLEEKFKKGGYGEHQLYPFFFCMRHYIELLLKSVIYEQNYLASIPNNKNKSVPIGHDLGKLFEIVKDNLTKEEKDDKKFKEILKNSEEIIKQIDEFDKSSQCFRYVCDNKGNKPNYHAIKNFKHIKDDTYKQTNTSELEELLKKVSKLEGLYYYYNEKIFYLNEELINQKK